jgi:hypothetical protein
MRWILFWFALLTSSAFLLISFKPFRYDRSASDYRWIVERIDHQRAALDRGERIEFIDWRQLPGPPWEHLCVVGGYRNTAEVAERYGIPVPDRDRNAVEISEWEMGVLIIYPDATSRLIILPLGYPEVRQGEESCVDADGEYVRRVRPPAPRF